MSGCIDHGIIDCPECAPWRDQHDSDCAEIDRLTRERDRAVETRENANRVSLRVEAENRRLRAHLDERTAQRDALEAACRRLMAAYEAEEDEDGFPFSFELRDAHRALQALLADHTEDTP